LSRWERGVRTAPAARPSMARRCSPDVSPGAPSTLSSSRCVKAAYRPPLHALALCFAEPILQDGTGAVSRQAPARVAQRPGRPYTRRMTLLKLLLLVVQSAPPVDTVPPYLSFPEPGLDDPAAYEGYETRVYRDASGNAFQVYLNRSKGRVVHLWADAVNESAGFTARDSAGTPAELAWSSGGAIVGASGQTRSVSYGLETPSSVTLGLFLLGSMRVERDLQYARRDSLPLDAVPFPQAELSQLIDHIAKLRSAERARHLSLLGVTSLEALRARLLPRITAQRGDTVWVVRVEQVSFDGKSHLWLALEGDARETVAAVTGRTITIRRPAGGLVRFTVRVTTDAAALTPLSRTEMFN